MRSMAGIDAPFPNDHTDEKKAPLEGGA